MSILTIPYMCRNLLKAEDIAAYKLHLALASCSTFDFKPKVERGTTHSGRTI